MDCQNCKKQIDNDAKFCNFCGQPISNQRSSEEGSVDMYFNRKYNSCQSCGIYGPTKYVEFYQNIGMLVQRRYQSIKGKLCKNCINKNFRQFTLTTLFLGWWGTISFLVTPFYLINNVFRYITSLRLKSPEEKK